MKPFKENANFISELNVSHTDFARIHLLQPGICECVTCYNGSSTKELVHLNPVLKQVKAVMHDKVCVHIL